jgi:hydroxymethylpyrimidine pyrophosphatase-like HAD family hydrolase
LREEVNAGPEVQAQANFVTLSNEKDGFAYVIDKFVLPKATSAPTS